MSTSSMSAPGATDPLPEHLRSSKPATEFTRRKQQEVRDYLPFDTDTRSFEDAKKGFIATLDTLTIVREEDGNVVYDLTQFDFLTTQAPDTVNPSLWRQAQLNAQHTGLFEVCDGIYQVRSFDLANMTLVRSTSGWIIIDPLTASETSKAALALANKHLGERPVVGVIITHSHIDHFGGILGVVSAEDAASGAIPVIAPPEFAAEALAENVLAGNVMGRRATYMYGNLLPAAPDGFVSCGLGANLALGTTGFVAPNDTITATGETRTIDGVEIDFQLTMGTEAPAEMVFYFPQFKALCMSEITSHHLHNVYTPRGAQVRDALAWSAQIDEAIDRYANQLDIQFASHHWPIWGRDNARDYLEKQRDLYKYIHDQTLRLANHGYTKEEIADQLRLPDDLGKEFYNRDYYGTLNHNSRAVYIRYLGEFSGNPSSLNPLPPAAAAEGYVRFMGGPDAVVSKATEAFANNEFQLVCEVVQHVVNVDPTHAEARALLADALEQLGYQAESGPWRNFYLCGALELRFGVPKGSPVRVSTGMARGMPLTDLYKAMAVRLNSDTAKSVNLRLNLEFTDLDATHLLQIKRSVLHGWENRRDDDADATLKLTSLRFKELMLGAIDGATLISNGELTIEGDLAALGKLPGLFDQFVRRFPIMTPRG